MNRIKETIEESIEDYESRYDGELGFCHDLILSKGFLKSSQHKLLDTLVQELIEMRQDFCRDPGCGCEEAIAYNQALSDVITLIKEARE